MRLSCLYGIFVFSVLLITGCGGGGGSSSGTSTGQLIDSPLSNIKYETTTGSGVTDENGLFTYNTGDIVTFLLGSIKLGKSKGNGSVFISQLNENGDKTSTDIDVPAINKIRFLLTLDSDKNPSNGIQISDQTVTLLEGLDFINLNFSKSVEDFEFDSVLKKALSDLSLVSLISVGTALSHAQCSIKDTEKGNIPDGVCDDLLDEPDSDGDGTIDKNDLCPLIKDQNDLDDIDNDNIPDACDPDKDGDGVGNSDDAFPLDPNESVDTDKDGIGNNSDTDDDGDGVDDLLDSEPLDPNISTPNKSVWNQFNWGQAVWQ